MPPRRDPSTTHAAPAVVPHPQAHGHRHRHGSVERIFEPFPKPVLYLFGLLLVLALLAPFWLTSVSDQFNGPEIVISEDLPDLAPSGPATSPQSLLAGASDAVAAGEYDLGQFAGIRLDMSRDELQARYNLRLKNTRGMEPEIYQATDVPRADLVTFSFYDNRLKEFVLVQPEQRVTPLALVRNFQQRFGDPSAWDDIETPATADLGSAAPQLHGTRDHAELLEARLERFPYQQQLVWQDADQRLSATIHYSSKLPVDCVSVLSVRVSASAWLDNRAAQATAGVNESAPAAPPEETGGPMADETPQRLFP